MILHQTRCFIDFRQHFFLLLRLVLLLHAFDFLSADDVEIVDLQSIYAPIHLLDDLQIPLGFGTIL